MASLGTNKRRRTFSNTLHITDLPIGFLVDVSSYLTKPSRAIFAVAISASSSSWKKIDRHQDVQKSISDSSKAIIAGTNWDTLDFADIEKNLAERLTDDNLHSILSCIAIQTLRILKLTNCTNFIGDGLKPLQSSTVLELIDLSLKGKYDKQENDSDSARLLRSTVLPILHNIIATEGCSLKYVMLSPDWFSGLYHETMGANEFLEQYTQVFRRREYDCSKCGKNVNEHLFPWLGFSRQRSVCYNCLKVICDDCHSFLAHCTNCRKHYCADCEEFVSCRNCEQKICSGCEITCQGCDNSFCKESCLSNCDCQRMHRLLDLHW